MPRPNVIDRLAEYLAPSWALSRARARLAAEMLRDYDAAAGGRRTENWRAKHTSANSETAKALHIVRDRHRELVRNNPWATKAIQVISAKTVGFGITGEIKHPDKRRAELLNGYWQRWFETTACDADGLQDGYGLQALMMRSVPESGEVVIRRRRRRLTDELEVPLQIQLLEGDYLDHTRSNLVTGGRVVQGIQIDRIGRRQAYWMYRDHPGDLLTTRADTVPVPASEVAHVFRVERPGQMRGMPWGSSIFLTIRDLDGFEDAYLFRQKLANCLMAWVYDHSPSLTGDSTAKLPMPETLEPGTVAGLPAGKDVKFSEPPAADSYGAYPEAVLYRIAAGYGISFEALTGNLSRVNFTSGRMGEIVMHRNVEQWQWHMMIPRALEPVGRWFLEALALTGVDTSGAQFVWTPPRRDMVSPPQEIPAMRNAVRGGLLSLPEAHRELGMHSSQVLDEIAESNKRIDELGLVLDTDPRKTSAAGLTQARPEGTGLPSPDID